MGVPAALLVRPTPSTISSALDLGIGLLGAVLTALTLVLTLVFEFGVWPPLRDVVLRGARAHYWFVAASVGVALGVIALSTQKRTVGGASIGVTAFSFCLGTGLVFRSLELSRGNRGTRFLGTLLATRLNGEQKRDAAGLSASPNLVRPLEASSLAEFMQSLALAVAEGHELRVRQRVGEMTIALDLVKPAAVPQCCAVILRAIEVLSAGTISGRLGAETAPACVRNLVDTLADGATRLLRDIEPSGRDRLSEVRAGALLGLGARQLAWIGAASGEQAARGRGDATVLHALAKAAIEARKRLAEAVDPRPFGREPDIHDRWPHTLTDPDAALIWFWGCCELAGNLEPEAYVLAEMLTGERYQGSISRGDRIWDWVEERLRMRQADSVQNRLQALGGFRLIMSELLVTYLAGIPRAGRKLPDDFPLSASAHGLCSLRTPLSAFTLHGHQLTTDTALRLLARLVNNGQPGSRLWKVVRAEWALSDPSTRIPFVPPHQRPGAAVVAAALHLVLGPAGSNEGCIRDYWRALPDPLLDSGLAWMAFHFGTDSSSAPENRSGKLRAATEALAGLRTE